MIQSTKSDSDHPTIKGTWPVDTVAAGDTFIGAFVTRWLESASIEIAARFACAAAAIAVTRRGAQSSIPTRAEVDDLLERALR